MGVVRFMKYKVGDRVRMRNFSYVKERHNFFMSLSLPYVVDIKKIIGGYSSDDDFTMYAINEDNEFFWYGFEIEGLWSKLRPIGSRWELLDL